MNDQSSVLSVTSQCSDPTHKTFSYLYFKMKDIVGCTYIYLPNAFIQHVDQAISAFWKSAQH